MICKFYFKSQFAKFYVVLVKFGQLYSCYRMFKPIGFCRRVTDFFFLSFRFHDVPVGVFVETVTKLRLLSAVHQMVEPGKGRIQIGRLQSGVEALGRTQEQTGHELRNDGTSSQVIVLFGFHPFPPDFPRALHRTNLQ